MLRPFRSIHPTIHPSAYVDISAQVIGDVHLGAESSIWMNVVVRGDVHHVRIGACTNLQDLTLVHVMRDTHPTLIGDDVTVGHSAVVHGCTIEDRCLIGMGAILLNGCRIGTGSIVDATCRRDAICCRSMCSRMRGAGHPRAAPCRFTCGDQWLFRRPGPVTCSGRREAAADDE
jgi:UDP-3-O-[3-hydroxymyristoyl] glucosamine N-acyltransferase